MSYMREQSYRNDPNGTGRTTLAKPAIITNLNRNAAVGIELKKGSPVMDTFVPLQSFNQIRWHLIYTVKQPRVSRSNS